MNKIDSRNIGNPYQQGPALRLGEKILINQWRGQDPLLTQGQGYGSVFPNREETPIWLPARNLKFVPSPQYTGEDQDDQ